MQLAGKVALITGSAQGLGKAFAGALLQRGSKVCLSDVNVQKLETTSTEFQEKYGSGNVMYHPCDVREESQFSELFRKVLESFSKIDIVVNNAGIVDEKDWQKCIDINLNGVIHGTLLGIEHLRKDKGGVGGTILNVSSLAGVHPVNYSPAYAASKHGVIGYTRSWAQHPDMLNSDIRLLCLCPAFAETAIIHTKDGQILGQKMADDLVAKFGVMSVDQVKDAFMELLDGTDNNGSVLAVTTTGSKYLFQEEK